MELANIEKLVEKYLDAETSLQEEATLKAYFASDNVAPHLEEYQIMFGYFAKSKDETFTKTIELKTKKRNFRWLSVAASVVLLVSVYLGNEYAEQKKLERQYAQVENAIRLLSTNLRKGDEAFQNLYTYENTVNKIFNEK